MEFLRRLGQFLLLFGLGFLMVFWLSYQAGEPRYALAVIGAVAFVLGVRLIRKHRPQSQDTGRFKTAKKLLSKTGGKKK